mgnify:CR=1 FL=1
MGAFVVMFLVLPVAIVGSGVIATAQGLWIYSQKRKQQ